MQVNIYRLKPKLEGLNSPHWKASNFKGSCLVYAFSSKGAIQFANLEFKIAVSKPWDGEQPNNPWAKEDLVDITEVSHIGGTLPPCGTVLI